MSHFITGLICFIAGTLFGVFWMAALSLAKQADRDIENSDTE